MFSNVWGVFSFSPCLALPCTSRPIIWALWSKTFCLGISLTRLSSSSPIILAVHLCIRHVHCNLMENNDAFHLLTLGRAISDRFLIFLNQIERWSFPSLTLAHFQYCVLRRDAFVYCLERSTLVSSPNSNLKDATPLRIQSQVAF